MTTYKTGNPLGSVAPQDLFDNSRNLDLALNGSAPEWTDRFGLPHKSYALIEASIDAVKVNADTQIAAVSANAAHQIAVTTESANALIASLGYMPPVPYEAGLQMTVANQTVSYQGAVYAPVASDLPFETTGTFESDKFRLVQGVSGADLSADYGSAMVGHHGSTVSQELDARVIYGKTLADLQAIPAARLVDGQRASLADGTEYRWYSASSSWRSVSRQVLNNEGDTTALSMVDWANFSNASRRLFVTHHYNDAEMVVWDNVGDKNLFLLLRNARNPSRRPDKPADFVGSADFLRCQNTYFYNGGYQAFNAFQIKYTGDLEWGNQGDKNAAVKLINSRSTHNFQYSFRLETKTANLRLLEITESADNSVFQFKCPSSKLARLDASETMTEGMYISALAGPLDLEAAAGKNLRLRASEYNVRTATGWAFLGKFVDTGSAPSGPDSPGERGDFYVNSAGTLAYFCYAPSKWSRVSLTPNW
ncbi:hypothetical protein LNA76_05775 [Alcaligenes sp. MMA]|uniref:hypothetical protein n=1 Tax=Alcaligenes sp. MMA TaxID=2893019 RepID=UPI001E341FAC|nr:hypothetical protein [Alcaligenes sp. MMA]MCC9162833.1 hypothetical protein [Alcaligenes sp. MMA]